MNARAQRAFVPTLREVEHGLALPIPERLRILRELEYDLQELWGRLVEEGLPQTGKPRHGSTPFSFGVVSLSSVECWAHSSA